MTKPVYKSQQPWLAKFNPDVLIPLKDATVNTNFEGLPIIDLFYPSFCSELVRENDDYAAWLKATKQKPQGPNSMNKYGALLSQLGLNEWLTTLTQKRVEKIVKLYFPEVKALTDHYAFFVKYSSKQRALTEHVDSSLITMNVALTPQAHYTGGDVVFKFGSTPVPLKHSIGRAILHRGRVLHRARPTTKGERTNLIVWYEGKPL